MHMKFAYITLISDVEISADWRRLDAASIFGGPPLRCR